MPECRLKIQMQQGMDRPLRTASRTFQPRQQQKRTFGKPHRFRRIIGKVYTTADGKSHNDADYVQDWLYETGFIHFGIQGTRYRDKVWSSKTLHSIL